MISTCRIGCIGLPYAARTVRETEPLYVLPGGSPLDAKIDESANPIDVRRDRLGFRFDPAAGLQEPVVFSCLARSC